MNKEYKDNTEPKVGDLVTFKSTTNGMVYRVETVLGGRLRNKIGVVPVDDPKGYCREYYYYCFVKA